MGYSICHTVQKLVMLKGMDKYEEILKLSFHQLHLLEAHMTFKMLPENKHADTVPPVNWFFSESRNQHPLPLVLEQNTKEFINFETAYLQSQ